MDVITLNVGGVTFTTHYTTLKTVPNTRLSGLSSNAKEYDASRECYFFDRNPRVFEGILDFYRTQELHFPKDICGAVLRRELEFWEIPLETVSDCCFATICSYGSGQDFMRKLRNAFENDDIQFSTEQLRNSRINLIRSTIWTIMNFPKQSRVAMIYCMLYPVWLILPIITGILTTHRSCRDPYPYPDITYPYGNITVSITLEDYLLWETGNPKHALIFSTVRKPSLLSIERACIVLFTIEVLLRLICCPRFLNILKSPMLYIDVLCLLTSYIAFGIEMNDTYEKYYDLYVVCRVFLLVRVFRLLHLARHIGGLRVLLLTIRASVKELFLLLSSFLAVAVLFAAIVYYAEFDEPDTFEHMPIAIWWSVVTMTTVGYGDFTPSTLVGYVVGCICAIAGVLIVSMPIAVIAANFTEFYGLNKIREEKGELSRKSDGGMNKSLRASKVNTISVLEMKSDGLPKKS